MIKCNCCGKTFEREDILILSESHGFNDGFYEEYPVCPYCNDTDIEEYEEEEEEDDE